MTIEAFRSLKYGDILCHTRSTIDCAVIASDCNGAIIAWLDYDGLLSGQVISKEECKHWNLKQATKSHVSIYQLVGRTDG